MDFTETSATLSGLSTATLPADDDRKPNDAWLGLVLFLMIGSLAFLLASFPASNTDIALHLAHGKELIDSRLAALGAPDAFGDHSTWLVDLFCYAVFSAVGGGGLVVVKALLVVALAVVLMHLGRSHGWWIPAVCTALALLTMSTRLPLQPATFSYFLFAVALLVIRRQDGAGHDAPMPTRFAWRSTFPLLVILFVIWVNIDGWFQLGLLTIACFGLGRLLDAPARGAERLRSIVWGVSGMTALVAVCLLNPRGWHALELIPELRWLITPATLPELLATDQLRSPFQRSYWLTFGRSPAGLAYYPLLGLSLLSFLLTVRQWRWRWFLPWLALAILSAIQVRVIPFFAVLAGAAAALNLQKFFAAQVEDAQRWNHPLWRRGLWGLRALTIVVGLAFLIGAWPGWLQLPPYGPRRWAIELPPSLVRSALACGQQPGTIAPGSKALHLSQQTASVFAWLCPEEKGIWDHTLASALNDPAPPADAYERLRTLGVDHVIVHDPDDGRLFAALNTFFADPKQWPLLYLEGDVAIFGWRDPRKMAVNDPFAGRELDLERLALRPPPEKQAPGEPRPQHARSPRWWDVFWKPAPPRSVEREEATVYLLRAEAMRLRAPFGHLLSWDASHAAGLVGSLPGCTQATCFLDVLVRLEAFRAELSAEAEKSALVPGYGKFLLAAQRGFMFQRDDSPTEMIFLAIRAARRAVAHDPQDAKAYLILGDCYLRLSRSTRERVWNRRLRELVQLRQAQASEALNQAVFWNRELAPAHWNLAELYAEMDYLDLALEHRRAHFDLIRTAGVPFGGSLELQREQQQQLHKELQQLTKIVADLEQEHAEAAIGMRVLDRARLASRKGLAGKARNILTASDVAAFGAQGMALELELLLRTGRAKDVRDWTDPEQAAALGHGNFHWLRVQAFAASGDYARADEELALLGAGGKDADALKSRALLAALVGQHALEGRLWETSIAELMRRVVVRSVFLDRVEKLTGRVRQEAEVTVLRGLLALEQGRREEAETAFREALALWHGKGAAGSIDFDARAIAEGWLGKLR